MPPDVVVVDYTNCALLRVRPFQGWILETTFQDEELAPLSEGVPSLNQSAGRVAGLDYDCGFR